MTINQLMECVLGKSCAMEGTMGDATPFTEDSVGIAEKLCERLGKLGFEKHGFEQMTNGMTGELIDAQIFIGPTYYQRLKHLVSEKIHSRAQGHVTTLTRQPLEGSGQPLYTCDNLLYIDLNIRLLTKKWQPIYSKSSR
jgi:DNA-directed RNA polymerase II subunit RPB2